MVVFSALPREEINSWLIRVNIWIIDAHDLFFSACDKGSLQPRI